MVDVIRSSDPENGKWEKCGEVRRMADPSLFIDNGRFFFYYGLGGAQSTTIFEVDPVTFKEIEGTKKVLREYVTDINQCKSGYHLGAENCMMKLMPLPGRENSLKFHVLKVHGL